MKTGSKLIILIIFLHSSNPTQGAEAIPAAKAAKPKKGKKKVKEAAKSSKGSGDEEEEDGEILVLLIVTFNNSNQNATVSSCSESCLYKFFFTLNIKLRKDFLAWLDYEMSYKIRTTAVFDLEMQSVIDTLFDASMQFLATLVMLAHPFCFQRARRKS
jgi:hypothetical protein